MQGDALRGSVLRRSAPLGLVLAAVFTFVFAGCCAAPPDPWRGCTLACASCKLPSLQWQSMPHALRVYSAPHCAPSAAPDAGLPDEPEMVDDLQAILNTGQVGDASGALKPISVCPDLASHGWTAQAPAKSTISTCPGGNGACPDTTLSLANKDGTHLDIAFYDDPSSHPAPGAPSANGGTQACYYRVLSVMKNDAPITSDERL